MTNFNSLVSSMGKYAQAQYPFESCGIITKSFEFVPSKNLSNKPRQSFMLDPLLFIEYDENIWGIFHSHPGDDNPLPSDEDRESTTFEQYKFLVGFNNKFHIYWYDKNIKALMFDRFEEKHLAN